MTIVKRSTLTVAAISLTVLGVFTALVRPEGPFGGSRSSDADVCSSAHALAQFDSVGFSSAAPSC